MTRAVKNLKEPRPGAHLASTRPHRLFPYAESSAILAWILGEAAGEAVRVSLASAERVVSSTLTALECVRAVARGSATERIGRTEALAALKPMDGATASWVTLELTGRVLSRAREPFPLEPIRTLDALHLATALAFREVFPSITVVSLDQRVRANAEAMGFEVQP